jgi:prevent-host-death family protein
MSGGTVQQVNIHEAKTHFSKLVERAEAGEEIVIARNGKPVAKLVRYAERKEPRKLGAWEGQGFWVSDDFDEEDEEINRLFEGEESWWPDDQ